MARYTQDTRTQAQIDQDNLDAEIIRMAQEISESDEIGLDMTEEE